MHSFFARSLDTSVQSGAKGAGRTSLSMAPMSFTHAVPDQQCTSSSYIMELVQAGSDCAIGTAKLEVRQVPYQEVNLDPGATMQALS